MGMDGIEHPVYDVFTSKVQPVLSFFVGFSVLIISVASPEFPVFITIAAAYIMYESVDDFIDKICDKELEKSVGRSKGSSLFKLRMLEGVSVLICLVFLFVVLYLAIDEKTEEGNQSRVLDSLTVDTFLFVIPALFKLTENVLEVYFMERAIEIKKQMIIFKDDHLTSVVRDGYRLFLSNDNPSKSQRGFIIDQIEDMRESFSKDTLRLLKFESRVRFIMGILKSTNDGVGTGTDIYSAFGMTDVVNLNRNEPPPELRKILAEPCPFHPSARVADTHTFFFLPATIIDIRRSRMGLIRLEDREDAECLPLPLSAELMGTKAKNFIPGVGVTWRYKPIAEEARKAPYWVLMYIGPPRNSASAATTTNGIMPGTFHTTWGESMDVLGKLNDRIAGDSKDTQNKYDAMSNAEVVAGAFSHFVNTGDAIFHETFTRVVEETSTLEHSAVCGGRETSHLFIGRFNLSGLNNDAYLDVGGDESRHHLRGLSICRRFRVDPNWIPNKTHVSKRIVMGVDPASKKFRLYPSP